MPLYDFKCTKCGIKEERFAGVEEREQACSCGWKMERLISAPAFRAPMQPYQSPITGKWVDGEKMRREDLARSGSIPYDPGMKQDADRKAKEVEVQLDKAVDKAVETAWQQANN